ncbi:MAG: mechanosensitive ion channel family protein [Taibaiella sp.]|nr:mechanosensitive ion channel family protein [Taibaiella sp.]
MEVLNVQIIETISVVVCYIIVSYINRSFVNNALKKAQLPRSRRKITIRAANLLTTIVALVFLSAIWGLNQKDIAVFVSTLLTVLGIAFFAQWSLLSNITASVLIFFNHPMKIGDTIKILDKDFPYEGEITDLTYFFVHLKTAEGDIITIPNSLVLQKSISIVPDKG